MIFWGITAMTHDASLAVIEDNEILFASHSERYSKIKNDSDLNHDLIRDALFYGKPDEVVFYENPFKKKLRQFLTFDWSYAFDFNKFPKRYFKRFGIHAPITYVDHHMSHAASGYFTSRFDEATVVVIDALGEWQTITGWHAKGNKIDLKFEVNFPSSVGLLYSAFTKRCGLKPTDEEYILMGMAAYGEPLYVNAIKEEFIGDDIWLLKKPVHYGIGDWMPAANDLDLAASVQVVLEEQVQSIVSKVVKLTGCRNLVMMGGVALNCVCNSKLIRKVVDNLWIMPSPGDAGSCIGAVAAKIGNKIKWKGPYLGHNIGGRYRFDEMCDSLLKGEIIGVSNGRSEFGPRALGNRSLLADPRPIDMKSRVNEIKRRQKFRPFAPAIMSEHVCDWFDSPVDISPYMQFTARCKRPEEVPAVCHVDNTSRIQTVTKDDHPDFYRLLELFYHKTGCPMILNTSLNVRGKPMVNDSNDAKEFSEIYSISVF